MPEVFESEREREMQKSEHDNKYNTAGRAKGKKKMRKLKGKELQLMRGN